MWFPKPLYELLPYLYILVGLAVIWAGTAFGPDPWGSSLTFVAGLVLIVLGLAISMKRKSERMNKAARRARETELFGEDRG